MRISVPKIRVICGNKKCRNLCEDPAIEINFYTGEIVYVCPECGYDSKINFFKEARPYAKTKRMGS